MTETEKPVLTLQCGDRRARIIGAEGGIVFVREDITGKERRFAGKLLLTDGPIGAATVVIAERVPTATPDPERVGIRIVAPANALQVLARIAKDQGKQRFRHALALDRLPNRRGHQNKAVVQKKAMKKLNVAFIAATVALTIIVGLELKHRLFTFPAEMARVAAGGEVVSAEKAGRVVFLTDKTDVRAGEPVFGVRTNSGYEVATAAPIGGEVSQVLVRAGEKVRPGQPVLVVSPPDARPYVVANVRTVDAVKIARGVTATITYPDGSSETVPVNVADVQPVFDAGPTRVAVRIETSRDLVGEIGRSVGVRFQIAPRVEATESTNVADLAMKGDRLQ